MNRSIALQNSSLNWPAIPPVRKTSEKRLQLAIDALKEIERNGSGWSQGRARRVLEKIGK